MITNQLQKESDYLLINIHKYARSIILDSLNVWSSKSSVNTPRHQYPKSIDWQATVANVCVNKSRKHLVARSM